ncbi:MAG: methionine adenosyltransferase domain-containing protein [Kiritimatiellia bacterium]|nr:methionine adenosyltransferase domain-containing protein [Kiritimatiellia bacterium]
MHGTGNVSEVRLLENIKTAFDLRPKGIIEKLNLKQPVYRRTAAYGHFGRDVFAWEVLDREILRKLQGLLP